jgi:hypothetical protein
MKHRSYTPQEKANQQAITVALTAVAMVLSACVLGLAIARFLPARTTAGQTFSPISLFEGVTGLSAQKLW